MTKQRVEQWEDKIHLKQSDLDKVLDKIEKHLVDKANQKKIRKIFNAMKLNCQDRKEERLKEEEKEREYRRIKRGLKPKKAKPSKIGFQETMDQYDNLIEDLNEINEMTNKKEKKDKSIKEPSTLFKTNKKDEDGKSNTKQDSFLNEFSRTIHEMRKGDKCKYFFEKYI